MSGAPREIRGLLKVPIELVHFNPANVRDGHGDLTELADSIRAQGILQPLIVAPHPRVRGEFLIVAGHRRLEAAGMAGLDEVPVIVRGDLDTTEAVVEAMLVENLHRQDLTPTETAHALKRLLDIGLTQQQVAQRVGKSQTWVSHRLRLLELTPEERDAVDRGTMPTTTAERIARERAPHAPTFGTEHFGRRHPLATDAELRCLDLHIGRRLIGKVACAECWEDAIRADERQRLIDESREQAG